MATPLSSYHFPEEITPDYVALTGEASPSRDAAIEEVRAYCRTYKRSFLGYQSNNKLDFEGLGDFLDVALNNIGDSYANPLQDGPLKDGFFTLNTKWLERAVVDYFAERWGFAPPRRVEQDGGDWEDSYWGYVLSMGSTEGNLMALRSARDYLKGRRLLFERGAPSAAAALGYAEPIPVPEADLPDPVLLYSDHSHYSIKKLAQILEFEAELIPSDPHGRIDLDWLEAVAASHFSRGVPVAVSFNFGTTFTAAFDQVGEAVERVLRQAKAHGMHERTVRHRHDGREFECTRQGYWFHVDGALGAGHVTFARAERDYRLATDGTLAPADGGSQPPVLYTYPAFDFALDIQSLVVSGHKWPGAPWPTGVYMTKNRFMLTNDVPAYVGSLDSTLAGSRSGIAPLFLWDWLAARSDADRGREVQQQLALARYAEEALADWGAERAPGSVAVTFDQPGDAVLRTFSIPVNGDGRAHILCMPHVKRGMIDALVEALRAPALADATSTDLRGLDRGGW